uniref:Uncharacterized protein n=1 Tax=Glossina pallidipes TaxID=7398 RepID=A0A1A9ZPG8_GLOPL
MRPLNIYKYLVYKSKVVVLSFPVELDEEAASHSTVELRICGESILEAIEKFQLGDKDVIQLASKITTVDKYEILEGIISCDADTYPHYDIRAYIMIICTYTIATLRYITVHIVTLMSYINT